MVGPSMAKLHVSHYRVEPCYNSVDLCSNEIIICSVLSRLFDADERL